MDTYFFDNPLKAIVKAGFLFLTYIGSIVMKNFTLSIVFPTVVIYFLSNTTDYAELAFMREDKVKWVRKTALIIFVVMLLLSATAYATLNTDMIEVQQIVTKYYIVVYLICAFVWVLPLVDGIRGQFDNIEKNSKVIEKKMSSNRAFSVMKNRTNAINES